MLRVSFLLLCGMVLGGCQTAQSLASPGKTPAAAAPWHYSSLVDLQESRAYNAFLKARLLADAGDFSGAVAVLEDPALATVDSVYLDLVRADILLLAGEPERAMRAAEDALIQEPDSLPALLFLGNLHFNQEEDQQAATYFQRAVALDPGQENASLHWAVLLGRNGDFSKAVDVLKALLKVRPQAVSAEMTLGRIYREMGLTVLAEGIYLSLLDRQPGLEMVLLELGGLHEARGELEEALSYFHRGLRIDPFNFAVRHHIARLLIGANRLDEALVELQAIMALNSDDLEAQRKIGLIHLEREQWTQAVAVFKAILSADPGLEQVRFYLGTALEGAGEWQAALEAFSAIGAHSTLHEDAVFHRGFLLQHLERSAEAVALLEDLLDTGIKRHEIFVYLGSLYESDGQAEAALKTYERGLAQFPDQGELYYRKGLLLERQGHRAQSLEQMQAALRAEPNHVEALNFVGYAWAEAGEHLEAALALAQQAVSLKRQPHILDTLGWVYFRLGRLEEARSVLEEAAGLLPDDPVVLGHLGDVYLALSLTDQAREMYLRSLAADGENPDIKEKLEALP